MINYRSVADLDRTIVAKLWRIPRSVSLVAGVPRSGMLPATLFSLHLNLALTDVDSLLQGHVYGHGMTSRPRSGPDTGSRAGRTTVLVVDDSVYSGKQMERVRERLRPLSDRYDFLFLAVYGLGLKPPVVDMVLETVPHPRIFEWNVMRHKILEESCVDLDGVLCRDPSPEENDDGPRYAQFLETAEPYLLPSHEIGCIVTSRLEKYRTVTEQWLHGHGVRYRELVMVDLPDKPTRDLYHRHGTFKGEVFKSKPWAKLFIESSAQQAVAIASIARKPVFCVEDRTLYHPPGTSEMRHWAATLPERLAWKMGHLARWLLKAHRASAK